MPSGPPEQLQVQRVIQRMQKKDPYRIFADVPSEEMVRPLCDPCAPCPANFGTFPQDFPFQSMYETLHVTFHKTIFLCRLRDTPR